MMEVLSTCASCGSQNPAGVRFCSNCGARAQSVAVPTPNGLQTLAHPAPGGLLCDRCGHRMLPMPYFARGVNVAKAVVLALTPFAIIGPIIFFLWRKDRFICSLCHHLLSAEAPVRLLDAFSPETRMNFLAGGGQQAGALARDPAALAEIQFLDRKSRRGRRRAWTLGVLSAVLGAIALATGIDHNPEAAAVFLTFSAFTGMGTLLTGLRGAGAARLAGTKRTRQRMLQILDLARLHRGQLNVTLVASHLQVDFKEAEQALDTLVDGQRVDLRVDGEGRVSYVFPELIEGPALPLMPG